MAWLKSLNNRLKRLPQLNISDVALLLEAWITLTWIDLIIRFLPYEKWRHRIVLNIECSGTKNMGQMRLKQFVQSVAIAAKYHVVTMNCLRRTLALQSMLARRNLSTNVHIGVRFAKTRLEAHAWLSFHGAVINDSVDVQDRYKELVPEHWNGLGQFID
jgi:hypothetical protein